MTERVSELEILAEHLAAGVITDNEYVALSLRYERGLTDRKIALALGVSRTTIRDRLANALRKIRLARKDAA